MCLFVYHIGILKIPIQHSWIKTMLDFFGSPGVLFYIKKNEKNYCN